MAEIGLIGLPNVGKSTIFSLLTKISVAIDKFPFTTIEPNVGIVEIPDDRLDFIAEKLNPKKKTYATIKFVDIAGLVKGASKGEGLGNKFLSHIREVDGVVHVLRFFSDKTIPTTINKIEPMEEIDIVNLELLLSDIEVLNNWIAKLEPKANSGDKIARENLQIAKKIIELCNTTNSLTKIKKDILENIFNKNKEIISLSKQLLCMKDVLYLLNYDETTDRNELNRQLEKISNYTNTSVVALCGKFELSLFEFPEAEHEDLRKEYKIPSTELKNFIHQSVKSLNMITFYTTVGEEFRAWLVKNGTSVLDAAGKIHTDMKERFINAEVCPFEKFQTTPDLKILHQKGEIKIYGKDYIVKDGDIIKINFRH
ncbi:MAG: redox-regulated ATPase YchF [Endomicrobia bacterium]|nr:redox-regulated ATPase YchF [Endomicrobiia bacterium]